LGQAQHIGGSRERTLPVDLADDGQVDAFEHK
jgi:hypothetical protein